MQESEQLQLGAQESRTAHDAHDVFIARMILSSHVAAKLSRRGIAPKEVVQLRANGAVTTRNPRPRAPGSRLLIGPTDGGRLLTVVIERDQTDEAIWHIRTAWESSGAEQMFYYRRS
jgi:hypothetical protein